VERAGVTEVFKGVPVAELGTMIAASLASLCKAKVI
jgi:hypothetical protein